jgi:hypothetical protein
VHKFTADNQEILSHHVEEVSTASGDKGGTAHWALLGLHDLWHDLNCLPCPAKSSTQHRLQAEGMYATILRIELT